MFQCDKIPSFEVSYGMKSKFFKIIFTPSGNHRCLFEITNYLNKKRYCLTEKLFAIEVRVG